MRSRHHSRHPSFGQRLIQALSDRQETTTESKGSIHPDERVWYDQFTSTDWVHDSIADAYRVKALRSRKDLWGRMYAAFYATQGWILSALSGFVIAIIAYLVNVSEATMFDFKDGYCRKQWYLSEVVRTGCSPDVHGPFFCLPILLVEMLPRRPLRGLARLVRCVRRLPAWSDVDGVWDILRSRGCVLCS